MKSKQLDIPSSTKVSDTAILMCYIYLHIFCCMLSFGFFK